MRLRRVRVPVATLALVLGFFWWSAQGAPVPPGRGHWDARGATPEEAAREFVRPMTESPRVHLIRYDSASAKVRVRESFRGDDSVAGAEYTVVLKREGATWVVQSATYRLDCQPGRGWSLLRGSSCA